MPAAAVQFHLTSFSKDVRQSIKVNIMEIFGTYLFAPGITSMLVAILLVATKGWHGRFSIDTSVGIQKFHTIPTPRIGGIAIVAGLLSALVTAPGPAAELLAPMLYAGLPAFIAGTVEDLTKKIGVRERFLATMASGIAAFLLTGCYLQRLDLPVIDGLLGIVPVSVLFTAFAVAGVANAVNIIDGFNGLSSGTLVICFSALGCIALLYNDTGMASLCFLLAVVSIGFLVVNFPFGKIFLGDGGAYLQGFLLAWCAVTLTARNPAVSACAPLLVCAYPVMETIFSIMRRIVTRTNPGQADCAHMHSLIKINVMRRHFSDLPQWTRNSMVSPFCWSFAIVCAWFGIFFRESTVMLLLALLGCSALYIAAYYGVARYGRDQQPYPETTHSGVLNTSASQNLGERKPLASAAAD
jgi:UDP-N-acetylmuramyl pentapeptide phosphotransferase/UDP-N-acetylglucosamine-1-phosphate transferase